MTFRFALAALFCSALIASPPVERNLPSGWPWGVIPHVVDGGAWTTDIILANLGTASARYKLDFRGDDGAPRAFQIAGRGSATSFSGDIPAGGSLTLSTTGTAQTLNQGWAMLDSAVTGTVGIMAIFRQRVAGRPDYEATVLASTALDSDSVLPLDNTPGFVTSIAILNAGSTESQIPIDIMDEAGNRIAGETLRLAPGSKIAFATTDRWAQSAGRRGTIQFAEILSGLSVLGFRFGPTGAFTTMALMERRPIRVR